MLTGDYKFSLRTADHNDSHGTWFICDGRTNVSRTTYANLAAYVQPSKGTCTITIALPGVLTCNGHNLLTGDQVVIQTTGALPTGLTANTVYFVILVTANTIKLASSRLNAVNGTAINTSGSQSGVHTLYFAPFGAGDDSTKYALPEPKSRVPVVWANQDSTTVADAVLGATDGLTVARRTTYHKHSHTLTLPNHVHSHSLTLPNHVHSFTQPTISTPTITITDGGHNHTQASHNHTQNSHNHSFSGSTLTFATTANRQNGASSGADVGTTASSTSSATAVNQATTATNNSATTGITASSSTPTATSGAVGNPTTNPAIGGTIGNPTTNPAIDGTVGASGDSQIANPPTNTVPFIVIGNLFIHS